MEFKDELEKALFENSEQGSENWHISRAGRFTSSETHRLLKSGKREMTPEELKARPKTGKGSSVKFIDDDSVLSTDARTYIDEKVAEVLTGEPKSNAFSHATAHGDTWEPFAAEYFTEKTGLQTIQVSFIPFGDHAGGSPDRFIGELEHLEIKCPYNPVVMVGYLMLTDQYDLKRMNPEAYWQITSNSLISKRPKGHFMAFCPSMKLEKHKMVHIEVIPPEEDLTRVAKVWELAEKEKQSILKLFK